MEITDIIIQTPKSRLTSSTSTGAARETNATDIIVETTPLVAHKKEEEQGKFVIWLNKVREAFLDSVDHVVILPPM